MKKLSDLARELEELANTLPGVAASGMNATVAEIIVRRLIEITPVDTGQAISNWIVSLVAPSLAILPSYVPGIKGSTRVAVREATLNAALSVIARKQPGQTLYISNNLPYIRRLNDGYSAQAPAGFVEAAQALGAEFMRGRFA